MKCCAFRPVVLNLSSSCLKIQGYRLDRLPGGRRALLFVLVLAVHEGSVFLIRHLVL